jgi:hypothetical protein
VVGFEIRIGNDKRKVLDGFTGNKIDIDGLNSFGISIKKYFLDKK